MQLARFFSRGAACTSIALVLVTACGGSSGSSGTNSQTTIDDWRDYCVATFTEDYTFIDVFGDPAFTAHSGEEYVVASLEVGEPPELVYLATTGPETLTIDATADALPFTTDCTAGSTTPYLAVFSDTIVYAEEALSTPICELSAGTTTPRDTTAGAGYAITGSSVGSSMTYEVILNSFSADCGGADRGYISVPQTSLFGSSTWLVPIISIVGPA
jgi:hypothetical protein